jgi:hypothetical protein
LRPHRRWAPPCSCSAPAKLRRNLRRGTAAARRPPAASLPRPPGGRAPRPSPQASSAPPAPVRRPVDGRPASRAPVEANSAEAAAQVVRTYFDLIAAHRYKEAWRLWTGGGIGSGKSEAEFAAAYASASRYRAEVGAPGPVEGAAGSSYVTVPIVVHGRDGGKPFGGPGDVALRRVNDVPGSTDEQRRWHISAIAFP